MFKYLFIMLTAAVAFDGDARLKGPFRPREIMEFMHQKLHECQQLEHAVKRELDVVEKREALGTINPGHYEDLEEYFLRVINLREWGDKLLTKIIHASIPKEYLEKCGYKPTDIQAQLAVNQVKSIGDLIRVLFKREVYLITTASLVREKAIRSAFVTHTFFFIYQRIVSACAVLPGEINSSDLMGVTKMNQDELIAELAKAYYDGDIVARQHHDVLGKFMLSKIPYGISNVVPEPVEIVLSVADSNILDLDDLYTKWMGCMRQHFPSQIIRNRPKIDAARETEAARTAISIINSPPEKEFDVPYFLYSIAIERVSFLYYTKYVERLSLLAKQFDSTKRNVTLAPLAPTLRVQIARGTNSIQDIGKETQNITLRTEMTSQEARAIDKEKEENLVKIGELKTALVKLTEIFKDLSKQKEEAARESTGIHQLLTSESARLKTYQQMARDLGAEIKALQRQMTELQGRRLYSVADIANIKQQLVHLESEIQDLNIKIQQMMDPSFLKAQKTENNRLRQEQAQKQERIEKLRAELAARKAGGK